LLDLGHQKGISSIEVEIVQLPTKDNFNVAVCKATVMSKTGDSFIDVGGCESIKLQRKSRQAFTEDGFDKGYRRSLRSYTNIGITCLEELDGLDDLSGDNGSKSRKPSIKTLPVKGIADDPNPPATESNPPQSETDIQTPAISPEVKPENPVQQPTKPHVVKPRKANGKKEPAPKVESKPEEKPVGTDSKKNGVDEKEPTLSTAQKSAIFNLSRRRGISSADLEKMAVQAYGVSVDALSPQSASQFFRHAKLPYA
jgi:hypothetical protein